MLEWITVNCPYCGEPFETSVDCSAGAQEYIEDCPVCCHPNVIRVRITDDGSISVTANME